VTYLSREQVRISGRLSLVLRHRPEAAGLTLDAQGWVPVADLLTALSISRADLDLVVAHNDKSRFAITVGADGVEWIRASQGHSRRVPVDLGLPAVYPPQVLFHGTPVGNVDAIRRDGLRAGSRHHVHLSVDVPTALAVGRRRSPNVAVFEVAAARMAAHGHVFHHSDNGVWLTAAVPPNYLCLQPDGGVTRP
jgi:putative RNA 2'-phosphotransferase